MDLQNPGVKVVAGPSRRKGDRLQALAEEQGFVIVFVSGQRRR